MSQLQLLKVVVQVVCVELVDGSVTREVPSEPVTLQPADLDGFPASIRAQIDAHNAAQDVDDE